MSGQPGPGVRGRVWDPLVRLFHWSLAAAFAIAWFERGEAAIHETAGLVVLVLVIIRAAWGLIGPASARFETFIKGPIATAAYVFSIMRGRPAHFLGHNPAGAAMIAALLLALTATAASGLLMTTTALWGNAWIEWIHGTAATASVWLIAGHLAGVLLASLQHREILPLAMITGRKWMPGHTQAFLGASKFSPWRLIGATAIVLTCALAWGGSTALLNASLWRMNKIVTAAAVKQGCEVQGVAGPRLELYPEFNLRYEVAVAGRSEALEAIVGGRLALQKRPEIDISALAVKCAPSTFKTTSTYTMPPMAAVRLPITKPQLNDGRVAPAAARPAMALVRNSPIPVAAPIQQRASGITQLRQFASVSPRQVKLTPKPPVLARSGNASIVAKKDLKSSGKSTLKKKQKRKVTRSNGGNSRHGSGNSGHGNGNSGHGSGNSGDGGD